MANFITSEDNFVDDVWRSPGTILEQEKIEIIQRGFQLQAEGKISLKKYYEGTETDSLFQLKGYQIKYETIRKDMSFQNFINNLNRQTTSKNGTSFRSKNGTSFREKCLLRGLD